jgi:hypothetical protein
MIKFNLKIKNNKILTTGQMQWHTSIIPTLKKLRQENHEFEVSLT